jgi:hypothetical protein
MIDIKKIEKDAAADSPLFGGPVVKLEKEGKIGQLNQL